MIADSLSGVHIPLPAVRPRQRSWGTSLPQSVILSLCFTLSSVTATVRLVCGALIEGTEGLFAWLSLVFGVMSIRDGPM